MTRPTTTTTYRRDDDRINAGTLGDEGVNWTAGPILFHHTVHNTMGSSSARLSYGVKTHGERKKQNVITAAVHRNRTPRRGLCCSTVRDPTVLQQQQRRRRRRQRRRFHTRGAKQRRPAHSEDGWFVCGGRRPSSRRTAQFLRFGAHEERTEPRLFSRREIPDAHTYNNGTAGAPVCPGTRLLYCTRNENTTDNTMT